MPTRKSHVNLNKFEPDEDEDELFGFKPEKECEALINEWRDIVMAEEHMPLVLLSVGLDGEVWSHSHLSLEALESLVVELYERMVGGKDGS